jgi:hypothetical protein
LTRPALLVLDDYHIVQDRAVHVLRNRLPWWEANRPAWRARAAAARGDVAAVRRWLEETAPRTDLADAPLVWWTYRSIPADGGARACWWATRPARCACWRD